MIYLKIIFNVIQNNLVKFVVFLALSVSAMVGFEKKEYLLKNYMLFNIEKAQMSFVTDELGKSVEIKNKLMVLPGVKGVYVEKSDQLKGKLENLFKDDGFQEIIKENDLSYVKYTLTFAPMISDKSIKLIKSFIIKILPGKDVVFSTPRGVKNKGDNQKIHNSKLLIFYTIFSLLCVLILFLHHGIMVDLRKFSYLYQRFQRVKYVPIKAGLLFSFLCAVGSSVLIFSITSQLLLIPFFVMTSFLIMMTFLLNLKIYEWK
tara:strand:+ start:2981 stop:3760 length:780 start_codon:yes stop_codon:yes gene_type:complete